MRYFHVTPSMLETLRRELRDVSKVVPPGIKLGTLGFYQEKTPCSDCEAFLRWCHQESNRGHKDFQSFALPTELWHLFSFASAKVGLIFDMAKYSVDNFEIRRVGEGLHPREDWLCQPCGGGCVPLP